MSALEQRTGGRILVDQLIAQGVERLNPALPSDCETGLTGSDQRDLV